MVLHPLQNDLFRLGSLFEGNQYGICMGELENGIRSENVMFDHDPEPMVRLSHSGTEGIEVFWVMMTLRFLLPLGSSRDRISSIQRSCRPDSTVGQ